MVGCGIEEIDLAGLRVEMADAASVIHDVEPPVARGLGYAHRVVEASDAANLDLKV